MGQGVAGDSNPRRTLVVIDKFPQRMRVLSHHYQELSMLILQLLLMAQGVHSASQPCLSTPCLLPLAEIETIDQGTPNDETLTVWDESQETNELIPSENKEIYIYGISPKESKDELEMKESYKGYWRDTEDSHELRGEYKVPIFLTQPLVLFISRLSSQGPIRNGCTGSKNKNVRCLPRHDVDNTEVFGPLVKRGRINGLQKWTSAGLPFSVLYHHNKQMSRSKSNLGVNGLRGGNAQAAAQRSPDSGQWVSHAGPVVTTRKQYSTLPHLFVSYGWGPLGK